MWLLFEGSLVVMWLGERREAKAADMSRSPSSSEEG
jgi:hypothetical protein